MCRFHPEYPRVRQAFVEKLKGMGYERVELIPTDDGRFMTRWEATWMALSGSAILVGKK